MAIIGLYSLAARKRLMHKQTNKKNKPKKHPKKTKPKATSLYNPAEKKALKSNLLSHKSVSKLIYLKQGLLCIF